jgi:DNA repair protein RecO (recombination protein O)
MTCARCRPAGAAFPAPETVRLLAALLTGEWEIADASEERHRREATGMVSAYLQWHLERSLRSLPHVERGVAPRSRDRSARPSTEEAGMPDIERAMPSLRRSVHATRGVSTG